MTAFFVFFFPILLYLGSWQVIRGLEKQDIVNQHYENKSLPVVSEKEMFNLNADKLTYRTVNLYGEFGAKTYLLDNRLYRQEAGYEVFTTFKTSGNELFLVNRGWSPKEGFKYGFPAFETCRLHARRTFGCDSNHWYLGSVVAPCRVSCSRGGS